MSNRNGKMDNSVLLKLFSFVAEDFKNYLKIECQTLKFIFNMKKGKIAIDYEVKGDD